MKTVAERAHLIESLHHKYAGVIYDLCVRILRDSAEAEDAVQETFLNAFKSLDSFTYGESYLPWLYRIGTNACLKMIRTKKRKGAVPMENIEPALGSQEDSTSGVRPHYQNDPSAALSIRKQLEILQRSLDERNMEIVVSHFVLGLSQQEVADMLGVSRRAVVKRLTRLKNDIRELPLFKEIYASETEILK